MTGIGSQVTEYYALPYRLDGIVRWFLWFTDDRDGVVVDREDHALVFLSEDVLLGYAEQHTISPVTKNTNGVFDLDVVVRWLHDPRPEDVDPVTFLNAWNLCQDVARSVKVPLLDRGKTADRVYDKLFWGNNLPVVTPVGHHFEPEWSASEIVRLREALARGVEIIRTHTCVAEG